MCTALEGWARERDLSSPAAAYDKDSDRPQRRRVSADQSQRGRSWAGVESRVLESSGVLIRTSPTRLCPQEYRRSSCAINLTFVRIMESSEPQDLTGRFLLVTHENSALAEALKRRTRARTGGEVFRRDYDSWNGYMARTGLLDNRLAKFCGNAMTPPLQ